MLLVAGFFFFFWVLGTILSKRMIPLLTFLELTCGFGMERRTLPVEVEIGDGIIYNEGEFGGVMFFLRWTL